ncbi:MAG: phosphoribosyltransferase [Verrucomicrobiia bacterium]|jgi:predicted phosphoribosyltransferase
MFDNRADAGQKLARAVEKFRASDPLVLALPRGGVVVGAEIAHKLGCELDVVLVKKLRAPDNPELAFGAIGEDGHSFVNREIAQMVGTDQSYIDSEIEERHGEIKQQSRAYRKVRPRILPAGRTVMLVDDGLATGATMIAAVQTISLSSPQKIVVAVPVSSPEALQTLKSMPEVNDVVCLSTPGWFGGVGQFYRDFTQVSDEDVIEILKTFA